MSAEFVLWMLAAFLWQMGYIVSSHFVAIYVKVWPERAPTIKRHPLAADFIVWILWPFIAFVGIFISLKRIISAAR